MEAEGEISLDHPADIKTGNYDIWKSSATQVGVVIVGGGVAGLTAAKTLLESNVTDILLLEADSRLGGRVKTHREGDVLVEEGAEWIHGGKRNKLYQLATQLKEVANGFPDSDMDWRVVTHKGEISDHSKHDVVEELKDQADINGILEPYYHTGYGQFYVDRFPDAYGEGWNSSFGQAWLHIMEKTVNAEEGTNNWLDMSARDADNFVDQGQDHQWKNGYDTIIKYFKKSIPDEIIRISSPVSKIFWDEVDDGRVLVVAENGHVSYSARHVIMTPSVGHLKERHHYLFEPSLPAPYISNLDALDLGVSDKIQIGWKEPWWGTQSPLSLMILWTEKDLPLDMEWLYAVTDIFSVHQHINILQTFVTGNEAREMERLPKDTVKRHLLHLLATATGLKVPEPTFFARSQWSQNPWTRGSYSSYVTVEGDQAGLNRRKGLASPLVNSKGQTVLIWASEHLSPTRYGTVDGAMESGKSQANKLIQIIHNEQFGSNNTTSSNQKIHSSITT